MEINREQFTWLAVKAGKPYTCKYCLYHYTGECCERRVCDMGVEAFFSNIKGRSLTAKVNNAHKLIENRVKK